VKIVYDANSSLDAYVVKNLLETEGITAFVQGEYLQGGIGELAATGFVKVSVNDEDAARARTVIEAWEDSQPSDQVLPAIAIASERPVRGWNAFLVFVLGFVAGGATVWIYLQSYAS
jgi:hypothetical protein